MIDKDNDGRDNTAQDTTNAKDSTTRPNRAVVKDIPIAPANTTPGYSAGNPDAKETPADKIAPYSTTTPGVVAPAKVVVEPAVSAAKVAAKVAADKAYDDRARELDLARRAIDGSGEGVKMGNDTNHSFVSHNPTNLTTIEEIDRQSALLNQQRQDKRVVEQDKQAARTDKEVAAGEKVTSDRTSKPAKETDYSYGETFGPAANRDVAGRDNVVRKDKA